MELYTLQRLILNFLSVGEKNIKFVFLIALLLTHEN